MKTAILIAVVCATSANGWAEDKKHGTPSTPRQLTYPAIVNLSLERAIDFGEAE